DMDDDDAGVGVAVGAAVVGGVVVRCGAERHHAVCSHGELGPGLGIVGDQRVGQSARVGGVGVGGGQRASD
ncbi:MAG: hypothetical protein VCC01_03170, partial [Candidatus Hydrogenedentota bacterium]